VSYWFDFSVLTKCDEHCGLEYVTIALKRSRSPNITKPKTVNVQAQCSWSVDCHDIREIEEGIRKPIKKTPKTHSWSN